MRGRELDPHPAPNDIDAPSAEHALRVVARWRGLLDRHAHATNDTSEENGTLDLSARDLAFPIQVFERAAVHGHGQSAMWRQLEARPHGLQRLRHATHGSS